MKNLFFSLLLILSLLTSTSFTQTAKTAQAAPKNQVAAKTSVKKDDNLEVPFVSKVLPNGMEIIVLPDPSVPLVTVEIAVRNGSFTEPPVFNGLSHLYEHMFFKPNRAELIYNCELALQYGGQDYYQRENCAEKVKYKAQIGNVAYLNDSDQLNIKNATTREEVVNYFFVTTSPYLSPAMRFINDSIRYPTFDDKELQDEIKVVLGEVDRNLANPFFYLNDELNDKLFFKYPTRKKPLGTRATISGATPEKMREIQSRYYVPNNSALVVTGDADPQEVFKLAEQYFGDWKKEKVDLNLVEHPPLPKSAGYFVEQPVQNVLIQIGWQGPSVGKDDAATYAADVFSFILSQPDSRFQRKLVDSRLTSAAGIGYYTQRNVGPIAVTLVTTPDKAKEAVKAAYAEIAQFDKPGYFTDEELKNAKTLLESRDLFEREKLSDYTHTLSFWWSSTGIEYFRGYQKNLRAVSRDDINRYIDTYIQNKPHVGIAMVSPEMKAASKLTEQDLIGEQKSTAAAK